METKSKRAAYALLRITMGLNLAGHGLARLPKIAGFRDWMISEFQATIIPQWGVYLWGSMLPVLEFVVGVLILIGFHTYRATIVATGIIAVLVFGSCLAEKWEWAGGQMVYALILYFLIANVDCNQWSINKK